LSQSCVVRKAVSEDIAWLVAESDEFAKFFDAKIPLYNPEHLRHVFAVLADEHLLLVAEVNGERSGFIAGLYTPHFLNPNITTLAEVLFWITPKYRGSRSASLLLNEFVSWGKINADWIMMTLENKSQMKPQSLIKRGFKFKEHSYIMEVGV
jgi:GNAT superfamily N-acetyltransferase